MPSKLKKTPTVPKATQVLLLTPEEQLLINRQGQARAIQLGRDQLKGPVRVIDLTDTVKTTYVGLNNFELQEVVDAVQLDPAEYLPQGTEALDLLLTALPAENDRDVVSALIAYATQSEVVTLTGQLGPTVRLDIEPALGVLAQDFLTRGENAVVLQVDEQQLIGLLIAGGMVRARLRELAGTAQRTEKALNVMQTLAGLVDDVNHIGLVGQLDAVDDIAEQLHQESDVQNGHLHVKVFGLQELAQAAFAHPPLISVHPAVVRKASPLIPLAIGVAAALLPAAVLNAMNTGYQHTITRIQQDTAKLRPQVEEADRLTKEIAGIREVQAKAKRITDNRVDWQAALAHLTEQLPQESEVYTVRFRTLTASISNASGAVVTAAPAATATPVISKPLLQYTLDMQAASRAAATSAVTNFEDQYNFNLSRVSRDQNGWNITATAVEKPAVQESP